jgi:DNA-binding GntR family transcriptional regulator
MTQRSKNTRVDAAYEHLKSDILQSKLPPGFQAPEPDIALRLNMSRTPVREALVRLEGEGLVSLVPRRGVRVLGVSIKDLEEIYELLCVLEPLAVSGLATQSLQANDLERLEVIIRAMETATEKDDMAGWSKAEARFFTLLVRMHGNSRLTEIVGRLQDQLHRPRSVLLLLRGVPVQSVQDYRDLLASVVSGNADRAFDLAQKCRQLTWGIFRDLYQASKLAEI